MSSDFGGLGMWTFSIFRVSSIEGIAQVKGERFMWSEEKPEYDKV